MVEGPIYVIPGDRGGWCVRGGDLDELLAMFDSESEAEAAARRLVQTHGGTGRIVVRDCYQRIHEIELTP